jgi:4-hydroxy-3-polyprenylbenzoate decarboxylase
VRLLEILRERTDIESHLIVSPSALRTLGEETRYSAAELRGLAHVAYGYKDIGAAVASGSFRTMGMVVAPCSVRALSGIAHSYDADLMVRAADVCLKERRRLVLLLRETPLHTGHIELMARATRSGTIVMPPVPAFYTRPQTLDEVVEQTVARALDLFDIEVGLARRWTGSRPAPACAGGAARKNARGPTP